MPDRFFVNHFDLQQAYRYYASLKDKFNLEITIKPYGSDGLGSIHTSDGEVNVTDRMDALSSGFVYLPVVQRTEVIDAREQYRLCRAFTHALGSMLLMSIAYINELPDVPVEVFQIDDSNMMYTRIRLIKRT